ncbi:hypothetical protein [Arsenicibacter rosenii]|uniref:Uncharacterized protein n=1 Tax=Arsenicibacter rosenii TaxID=1750698 RepID=A0A1S2VAC9_9BACT|nr:hypothetical protein [Arsenicibacter rosenii]OIN55671.1 hypothetical protein BLX24_28750 [Arsenicibacter rosenii]
MRFLDDELISKYDRLPKSGRTVITKAAEKELGTARGWSLIKRLKDKVRPPTPDEQKWFEEKVNALFAHYYPEEVTVQNS